MNRLLGIVLDVEYLFTCVHKEEDADTKQVYFYLFKVRHPHFERLFHCHCSSVLIFHIPGPVGRLFSVPDTSGPEVCGGMCFSMKASLK